MVSANHKKRRAHSSGLHVTSDISQILIQARIFQTDRKQKMAFPNKKWLQTIEFQKENVCMCKYFHQ